MYVVEIIDAMSFASYNLIKVDVSCAKIKCHDLSLLLTQMHPPCGGASVYTHIG